jgi:hypothetical protein
MSIQNDLQLAVTRKKLRLLEERVTKLRSQEAPDAHMRELTLRSLMSLVNQLREEIVRYTARTGAKSST